MSIFYEIRRGLLGQNRQRAIYYSPLSYFSFNFLNDGRLFPFK